MQSASMAAATKDRIAMRRAQRAAGMICDDGCRLGGLVADMQGARRKNAGADTQGVTREE
jgi:hypothetical protein